MKLRLILVCTACLLVSCQTLKPGPYTQVRAAPQPTSVPVMLDAAGEFDNHEQVAVAAATSDNASVATPHIVVKITATKDSEWTLWQIRLDGTASLQVTWAMQRRAGTWVPYRAEAAVVSSPTFDSKQWTAIEGCILHGDGSGRSATANAELCASFTATLGAAAALLPLTVERDGDTLHVRLFADQARGPAARESAREVVYFGGWAAINGAGPNAVADSKDWHVRNDVRIGNEGGRFGLTWRDGKPSGYSLLLERMTYRNGNVPVLKLALTEDASDRTLAYAWANPEATRIGLNIGWVQVGLERAGIARATSADIR